ITMMYVWMPLAFHHGITFSAFPTKNSVFVTLFRFAFFFASFTASGTTSIPYTFFACWAIKSEIVPIPQYASMTMSLWSIFAYWSAFSYSFFVCGGLTW